MRPTERDDQTGDEVLLDDKTPVIYAAGGAIGGAVAWAFAREGAGLFLTGRDAAKVDAVAEDIGAAGVVAESYRRLTKTAVAITSDKATSAPSAASQLIPVSCR